VTAVSRFGLHINAVSDINNNNNALKRLKFFIKEKRKYCEILSLLKNLKNLT